MRLGLLPSVGPLPPLDQGIVELREGGTEGVQTSACLSHPRPDVGLEGPCPYRSHGPVHQPLPVAGTVRKSITADEHACGWLSSHRADARGSQAGPDGMSVVVHRGPEFLHRPGS